MLSNKEIIAILRDGAQYNQYEIASAIKHAADRLESLDKEVSFLEKQLKKKDG